MRHPTILTIILNYRTPEMTLKSAEAGLVAMEAIAGEILIVDNNSGDDSFDTLSRAVADKGWDRVRVVQSGWNGGFGAGNNFGIRTGLSTGDAPDYIYLLNSDAFPDPDALRHLLNFMTANPRAGMAGSHVRGPDGDPHTTLFRFPSVPGEFEGAARIGVISRLLRRHIVPLTIPDAPSQPDWVAGASVLMRRRMLDEIGLFDETFFLYYEETDLCRRAAQAGWRVHYIPQSGVVHIGSASTGMKSWRRTPRYWFESHRHYFIKNHGRAGYAAAVTARIAGGVIWTLRRSLTGKPRIDAQGHLRDLIAYALRPEPADRPTRPMIGAPVTEDSK